MLRQSFLAVIAVLGLNVTANAGAVHLFLIVNPATTAGFGIPTTGGLFNVTSTRSGPGTWQLYAVDDADGSFGIAQVKATMVGATHISNRLTQTQYDTDADCCFKAGLTLLRSASGVPGGTTNPVFASAELEGTQPYFQGGLGITAGNYSTIPGATAFAGTGSGQWGNYSAANAAMPGGVGLTSGIVAASGRTRNALYVGEGTYTGSISVDLATSWVAYYTNASLTTSSQAKVASSNPLLSTNPFIPEPTSLTLIGLAIVGCLSFVRRRR